MLAQPETLKLFQDPCASLFFDAAIGCVDDCGAQDGSGDACHDRAPSYTPRAPEPELLCDETYDWELGECATDPYDEDCNENRSSFYESGAVARYSRKRAFGECSWGVTEDDIAEEQARMLLDHGSGVGPASLF